MKACFLPVQLGPLYDADSTGVNLAVTLGGGRTGESRRIGCDHELASPGEGYEEEAMALPRKKMKISLEMACFGEF